jgi:protoporphyrinogen oxidase
MIKTDILIIGAGVSGLTIGCELKSCNKNNFLILEKESKAGGLCRSFPIGDSYYDIGAHALHGLAKNKPIVERYINNDDLFIQKRRAYLFLFGSLIPHPIQYHLSYLPLLKRVRCLLKFLLRKTRKLDDFKSWLISYFGLGMCEVFLFDFNHKVWCTDLSKISTNWVERIPSSLSKIIYGTFRHNTSNYSSNEYVCYPKKGGFENILRNQINRVISRIEHNTEVKSIDLVNKIVKTSNNKSYKYRYLINTIPLDIFISCIQSPNIHTTLKTYIRNLKKVSITLLTFLIKKNMTTIQRVYVSERKYYTQRVIINSNSSSSLRSKNNTVISMEISYKDEQKISRELLVKNSIQLLQDLKFINNEKDILHKQYENFEYAYPIQTHKKDISVHKVKVKLEYYDCHTIGRFGDWDYANIDGIMKRCSELVNRINN